MLSLSQFSLVRGFFQGTRENILHIFWALDKVQEIVFYPALNSESLFSLVLLIVSFCFFFRDSVCEKLLEYNVHKEKKDSSRFARGTSETFQALDNLVAKGVKVDLGIPKGQLISRRFLFLSSITPKKEFCCTDFCPSL